MARPGLGHLAPAPFGATRDARCLRLGAVLLGLNHQIAAGFGSPASRSEALTKGAWLILLQVTPILAGAFLGAPLLARESENATAGLAWTQGIGRTAWLLAKVTPITVLLHRRRRGRPGGPLEAAHARIPPAWAPEYFDLRPLPFAGWVTMGFCLGVFLGAAIRRTVPAMTATLTCYAALLWATSLWWRMHYLPLPHRPMPHALLGSGGLHYGIPRPAGPVTTYSAPRQAGRTAAWTTTSSITRASWFRLHHVRLWVTYQPGSRFGLFQVIEFGWLVVLARS